MHVLAQQQAEKKAAPAPRTAEEEAAEEERMAAALLPRKKRNLYDSIQKRQASKRARVHELEKKCAALKEA